jgi:hypothetical protein
MRLILPLSVALRGSLNVMKTSAWLLRNWMPSSACATVSAENEMQKVAVPATIASANSDRSFMICLLIGMNANDLIQCPFQTACQ